VISGADELGLQREAVRVVAAEFEDVRLVRAASFSEIREPSGATEGPPVEPRMRAVGRNWSWAPVSAAAMAALGALFLGIEWKRAGEPLMDLVARVTYSLSPSITRHSGCQWTPNGRGVVFVATSGDNTTLFLQGLHAKDAMEIAPFDGYDRPVGFIRKVGSPR
jgi:hypothetical protein